jgi:recombination protein RecA
VPCNSMSATFSKKEIESEIASRFGNAFRLQEKPAVEFLATGVAEVDALTGGVPRGAITEIFGLSSSGRTSLMFSMLAYASNHDEICALVDNDDSFAPTVAAKAGIDFDRLLWIRCASNLEHAFKATDLLLHAGGFGLVILDMGDVVGKDARRIISSWWYRFRRTVENKLTAIIVITQEASTRSCASLTLELNGAVEWSRANGLADREFQSIQTRNIVQLQNKSFVNSSEKITQANLLRANSIKINRRRPITADANEGQFSVQNFF